MNNTVKTEIKNILTNAYLHFGVNNPNCAERKAEETISNMIGTKAKTIVVDGDSVQGYYIPVAVESGLNNVPVTKVIDGNDYVYEKVVAVGVVATNEGAYLIKQTYDYYDPDDCDGTPIYENELNTKIELVELKGKFFLV